LGGLLGVMGLMTQLYLYKVAVNNSHLEVFAIPILSNIAYAGLELYHRFKNRNNQTREPLPNGLEKELDKIRDI